jgi:hypothetical protein
MKLNWYKSPEGAESYAVLLSIYTTCRLRKISFIDFLKASLIQHIKTGKIMLIKEYVELQENRKVS